MFKKPVSLVIWVGLVLAVTIVLTAAFGIVAVGNTDGEIQVPAPTVQATSTPDCVNVGTPWNGLIRTIDWDLGIVCYEGDNDLRCFLISETNLEQADSK